MRADERTASVYRFGQFELDLRVRELRKAGIRLRLQQQPFNLLLLLIEHAGETVTRDQIRSALWPADVHVDYDNAINSSMRKLRETLCDNSDRPRFIETQSGKGYRFIGRIDRHDATQDIQLPPRKRNRAARTPLVVGIALLLAMAAILWRWPRPEPSSAPLTPVPLTGNRGAEGEPSFSPDGTQIAYSWNEGARPDADTPSHIYVKLIGEGQPIRVTSRPASDISPAWSPDGRFIAFVRKNKIDDAIYVIPALGGKERLLSRLDFAGLDPDYSPPTISWSPDSRLLAVSERTSLENGSFISLVKADSGEKTPLITHADPKEIDANPVFSPDGRVLLFVRCQQLCGLSFVNLTPAFQPISAPQPLGEQASVITRPSWTPDGKEIVYVASNTGYESMFERIRFERPTVPKQFKYTRNVPSFPTAPVIAALGNRLAYAEAVFDVQVWQVHPGQAPRRFVLATGVDESAQFSPDGTHVVFASNRSGNPHQIWMCDRNGANPVQVTHFAAGDSGTPRWSPDGGSIAFDRFLQEGWRIFITSADGTHTRRLTDEHALETIPSWSGDGKWVYYTSDRTGRYEIWKAPIEGGRSVRVTRNGGYTVFESSTRHSLIYTKHGRTGIWEVPLQGGQERLLIQDGGEREFAVVGDGIYYLTSPNPDGYRSLRFHSFTSSRDQQIAMLNVDTAEALTVSPDRQTFLFTAAIRNDRNVMLVEGFR